MTSIMIDRLAGLSSAVAVKAPCRVATTANITLSGLQTVDGVALAEGDRVLVRSQSNSALNAIYIASTGDWEIAKDFSRSNDVLAGSMVYVAFGSTLSGRVYVVAYTGDLVIGTTAITFTQIFQAGAGAGDMLKANNLSELPSPSTALGNLGGAPLASPVFTGTPTAPTPDISDNTLKLATTAFVNLLLNAYAATVTAALALKATLASPAFTGSPTAPTATLGDNTTKLATTAFVLANVGSTGSVTCRTTGAITSNSSTLADVTNGALAVAANHVYDFKFVGQITTSSNASRGFKLAVSVPSGSTLTAVGVAVPQTGSVGASGQATTSNGTIMEEATDAGSVVYGFVITGTITTTNAGNIQLRLAQSVTAASNVTTLASGCAGSAIKIS